MALKKFFISLLIYTIITCSVMWIICTLLNKEYHLIQWIYVSVVFKLANFFINHHVKKTNKLKNK